MAYVLTKLIGVQAIELGIDGEAGPLRGIFDVEPLNIGSLMRDMEAIAVFSEPDPLTGQRVVEEVSLVVTADRWGILVINGENPAFLTERGRIQLPSQTVMGLGLWKGENGAAQAEIPYRDPNTGEEMTLLTTLAFVAGGSENGVQIFELKDRDTNPVLVSHIPNVDSEGRKIFDYAVDCVVDSQRQLLYVSDWWEGVKVIDISNPMKPVYSADDLVMQIDTTEAMDGIVIDNSEGVVYISDANVGTQSAQIFPPPLLLQIIDEQMLVDEQETYVRPEEDYMKDNMLLYVKGRSYNHRGRLRFSNPFKKNFLDDKEDWEFVVEALGPNESQLAGSPQPLVYSARSMEVVDEYTYQAPIPFVVTTQWDDELGENTASQLRAVDEGSLHLYIRKAPHQFKEADHSDIPKVKTNQVKVLVLAIDGIRSDSFDSALEGGYIPNIAELIGYDGKTGGTDINEHLNKGIKKEILSMFPTVTFTNWASIYTGTLPREHGILGNRFLAGYGLTITHNTQPKNKPIMRKFDKPVDAALLYWGDSLADWTLLSQGDEGPITNIYQELEAYGAKDLVTVVSGAQYRIGADYETWGSLWNFRHDLGLAFQKWDSDNAENLLGKLQDTLYSDEGEEIAPDLMTLYFASLDHLEHDYGWDWNLDQNLEPKEEPDEMEEGIIGSNSYEWAHYLDTLLSESFENESLSSVLDVYDSIEKHDNLVVSLVIDHGHTKMETEEGGDGRVQADYVLDMVNKNRYLTAKAGAPRTFNSVMGLNGPVGHLYLYNSTGNPVVEFGVLKDVASAIYMQDPLQDLGPGKIDVVMVKKREGDDVGYHIYVPGTNTFVPVNQYFEDLTLESTGNKRTECPEYSNKCYEVAGQDMILPVERINDMFHPVRSGDILLLSNYDAGFYFDGKDALGWHGSLNRGDSEIPFVLGFPEGDKRFLEGIFDGMGSRYLDDGVGKGSISTTADIKNVWIDLLAGTND